MESSYIDFLEALTFLIQGIVLFFVLGLFLFVVMGLLETFKKKKL